MHATKQASATSTSSASPKRFVRSFWGVRYQVKNVSRSADFYTQQLGFNLDHKKLPAFKAAISSFSSAALGHRVPDRCPTDITRSWAGGIGSFSKSLTSPPGSKP